MSNYKLTPEYLYEHTNKGLDIIFKYCPNAIGCERTKKLFKLREEEDTASASLIEKPDCWVVKDFGDKGFSPIELCRYFTGLSFIEALRLLYAEFSLSDAGKPTIAETIYKTTKDKEVGWFEVIENDNFTHLDLVGRFLNEKTALEYDFISVKEYSFCFKNKKTNENTIATVKANDNYPIFAYKFCHDWAKIYQPLAPKSYIDKDGNKRVGLKHSFVGKKPERHVYGLTRLKAKFDEQIEIFDAEIIKLQESNADQRDIDKKFDEKIDFKLSSVIICSGGSDGLNVASLDHNVIWYNSESEQLNYEEYQQLKSLCKEIYNLPDIDKPGTDLGHKLAETFWNLKTIWIPDTIKQHNGKDFRDWMKRYSKSTMQEIQFQFINLRTGALKCKFFVYNPKTKSYKIKPSYLHYFLKVKGFYLYYPDKIYLDKSSEQEFIFIRIENNIVYQEFANTIRKYCEKYLIDKGQPVEVIDVIKSTTQFTDKNLMSLDPIVLNFKNYTADSQTFYFKNQFATVTANGVELSAYRKLESHVWNDKIINQTIYHEKPYFEYLADENGVKRLKILRNDCEYQNFLINTSRIYWRKDLEDQFINDIEAGKKYHELNRFRLTSDFLSLEENLIQEQHYASKLFAIGYMLHKYKQMSFARMLYIMDDKDKESEEDRNGGSGKSLILGGIDCLLKNRFRVDGMKQDLYRDQFLLGGVTKDTDYILFEDLAEYHQVEPMYNWITGSLEIRPIYKQRFEIDFYDAPKIALTRNFGLKSNLLSTLRRILFISTSDYYHKNSENYKEERRVSHDFGHDLFLWTKFKDVDNKQASIHYGFLFQCLQFYLQHREQEITAPMHNIDLNNVKAGIGDVFIEWCESYFTDTITENVGPGIVEEIKGTLNEYIPRSEMQDNYKQAAGKFAKTSSNFKKSLISYCKLKGWDFNPKTLQQADGTIKKAIVDKNNKRQVVEHFYIKTNLKELQYANAVSEKVESEVQTEKIIQQELFNENGTNKELDTNVDF